MQIPSKEIEYSIFQIGYDFCDNIIRKSPEIMEYVKQFDMQHSRCRSHFWIKRIPTSILNTLFIFAKTLSYGMLANTQH